MKKILTVNLLLIFAAQTALSKDYKSMTIDDYFKRENVCISKIGDDSVGYYPSYEPNGWAGRIRNIGNKKVEYHHLNDTISAIGDDSVGYYPSYEPNGWAGRIRNIGNKKVEYCD